MSNPEPETYDYMGQADPNPNVAYEEFPENDDMVPQGQMMDNSMSEVPPF